MSGNAHETRTVEITPEMEKQAQELMAVLHGQISAFETFVARRFDEISTEINATSQQVDMVEGNIAQRFGDILGTLGSISHHGEGLTPANAGVELDAVIKTTEDAANTILDSADNIAGALQQDVDWTDDQARKAWLDGINANVQDILLACTFQDLTGQRITKAIENLRAVETQLNGTLSALGIEVPAVENAAVRMENTGASQDDIDALFGGGRG